MLYTLVTFFLFGISPMDTIDELCLSANEESLYEMINEERKEKGLPEIALSKNLTVVAKMHAADLAENKPFDEKLCNPHSWSNQGVWKACCYRQDHSNPECMWKKPSEITDYEGDGYEIVAFWMSGANLDEEISPETALQMWLESPGHSNVILNEMSFRKVKWNAVGIAIRGNYASVWFGEEKDNAPPPQMCSN
jgi:uncharacterized protein YkwD